MGFLPSVIGIRDQNGDRVDAPLSDGTHQPIMLELGDGMAGESVANGGTTTVRLTATAVGETLKSALVAAPTNLNLASSFSTIDGTSVETGDRILLWNQTTTTQNGPYVLGADQKLTRSADTISYGATISVRAGTYANTVWQCTTQPPIELDTTPVAFVQVPNKRDKIKLDLIWTFSVKTYGAAGNANYLHTDHKWYADASHTVEATDDRIAIKAAIDAAAAVAALGIAVTVVFPDGGYYLKSVTATGVAPLNSAVLFSVPSNVSFVGEGNASLRLGPGLQTADYAIMHAGSSVSNVRFENLRFNGNAQDTPQATIERNFFISLMGDANRNIVVDRCTFENHGGQVPVIIGTALNSGGRGQNVRVINCSWIEIGNVAGLIDHISLYVQADGVTVANNVFFNDPATNAISRSEGGAFQVQGTSVLFSGNSVTNYSTGVLLASVNLVNSRSMSVVGNTFELCSIGVSLTCSVGSTLGDIAISNNTFLISNDAAGQSEVGIGMAAVNASDTGVERVSITGNTLRYLHDARWADVSPTGIGFTGSIGSMVIADNIIEGFPVSAIILAPTAAHNSNHPPGDVAATDLVLHDVKVVGNRVRDCGASNHIGIYITADSTVGPMRRVEVRDNTIVSTGAALTNGIYISGAGADIHANVSENKFFNVTNASQILPSVNGITNYYRGFAGVSVGDAYGNFATVTYDNATIDSVPGTFRFSSRPLLANAQHLMALLQNGSNGISLIGLDSNNAIRIDVANGSTYGLLLGTPTPTNSGPGDITIQANKAYRIDANRALHASSSTDLHLGSDYAHVNLYVPRFPGQGVVSLPYLDSNRDLQSLASSAAGQEIVSSTSGFFLCGPVTGTDLTNADATLTLANGHKRVLPASTLSADRTYTLSTSGLSSSKDKAVISVWVLDATAHQKIFVNGGTSGGTMHTVPNSTKRRVDFVYDDGAGDWLLAGWEDITSVGA